jgi:hypothetical protein
MPVQEKAKIINHRASIYGSEGKEEDEVLFAPSSRTLRVHYGARI